MTKGVVYTPRYWADWAVRQYRIDRKWMDGAIILDPGCGRGALSEAVLRNALKGGYTPGTADLRRLMGMDVDGEALESYRNRIRDSYGLVLPEESARKADFLLERPSITADVIFSNPPWVTFGDLSKERKELYKPVFRSSGLTPSPRDLLLGGSRIDLAALFVAVAMERDVTDEGEAYFFLPMSLFRSEGAHAAFRHLALPGGRNCSLREVRELDGGESFPGAGTRYGFASFSSNRPQIWPIPWYRAESGGRWKAMKARPVAEEGSPLVPFKRGSQPPRPPRIPVPPGTRPRQGVNSGGAAEAFILTKTGSPLNGIAPVVNSKGIHGNLPEILLHPLMNTENFSGDENAIHPERWIFLPYHEDGRILSEDELESYPVAIAWLEVHRNLLQGRKGTMIRRWTDKGTWWALLGVAPYAFAPWKVAWEAYGRDRFAPKLFKSGSDGFWQGNQALHAYLPFTDGESAERSHRALSNPETERYLRNLGGANTKLWAQPGRIRRLLDEINED